MATNTIPCEHDSDLPCHDSSYSKCPHCSLDLCLEHLNEHQQIVRYQFNEIVNRINEQKAKLNSSERVNDMRIRMLNKLDAWRATKIETIMTIYNTERTHIENVCEQCITEQIKIQKNIFDDILPISNNLEKKKNIHPRDIHHVEQKLNELNNLISKIHDITESELMNIVTNIKLPEIAELEQRFNELQHLQAMINEKDKEINNLRQNLRRFVI